MKKLLVIILFLALGSVTGLNASDFSVTRLKCEYMDSPVGIGTLEPHFSWQSVSIERGFVQGAYEIIVGDDPVLQEVPHRLKSISIS